MGRILMTIKYGDRRTKRFFAIFTVVLLSAAAAVAWGLLFTLPVPFILGVTAIAADIIVLLTRKFRNVDVSAGKKVGAAVIAGKRAEGSSVEAEGFADDGALDGAPGGAADAAVEASSEEDGEDGSTSPGKGELSPAMAAIEARKQQAMLAPKETLRGEGGTPAAFAKYTDDKIKYLLKKYRVPRDYVPIMIDSSVKSDIDRTPAICWTDKQEAHFLLFEVEERLISMMRYKFRKITYHSKVPEKNKRIYDNMQQNADLYGMFSGVMPVFTRTQGPGYQTGFTKNLYVIDGDIEITAGSMRDLAAKYDFDYSIFGSFDLKGKYSNYFKKAYEKRVLWVDGIISQESYQEAIRETLQTMVDDDNVSSFEFSDDIELMVKYRMVTREYGNFFINKKREMF